MPLAALDEIKRRGLIEKGWIPSHTLLVEEVKLAFDEFRGKIPVYRIPGGFAIDIDRGLYALLASAVRNFPHAIIGLARSQQHMHATTIKELAGSTLRVPTIVSLDARYKGGRHTTMGDISIKIPGLPMDSPAWHIVWCQFHGKVQVSPTPSHTPIPMPSLTPPRAGTFQDSSGNVLSNLFGETLQPLTEAMVQNMKKKELHRELSARGIVVQGGMANKVEVFRAVLFCQLRKDILKLEKAARLGDQGVPLHEVGAQSWAAVCNL